jgi:hypothetical protein
VRKIPNFSLTFSPTLSLFPHVFTQRFFSCQNKKYFVVLPAECKDIIYGRRKEETEKEEIGGRWRRRTQETVAGDVCHAGGNQGDAL